MFFCWALAACGGRVKKQLFKKEVLTLPCQRLFGRRLNRFLKILKHNAGMNGG